MNGFEDLALWKECRRFRNELSKAAKALRSEKKYWLVDQLLHSSRSITANIAEGHGRFYHQENIQFCRQAKGSLSETLDHIICAYDEGYINDTILDNLRNMYLQFLKLRNGYILFLGLREGANQHLLQ